VTIPPGKPYSNFNPAAVIDRPPFSISALWSLPNASGAGGAPFMPATALLMRANRLSIMLVCELNRTTGGTENLATVVCHDY
jgi:hypothetical protein